MLLITILRPIIVESIAEPPYDIIGSGDPTIGINPNTILILTVMYINIDEAKPKQYSLEKKLLEINPITIIL